VSEVDRLEAERLDAECRDVLASHTFGRVGTTSGGLPIIVPVRYRYAADVITFDTGSEPTLRAVESGDVLAFQVDGLEDDAGGWSVHVLGRATIVNGAAADRSVRLSCEFVSGGRFGRSVT
jgi:nitroimidazol reductase NimA-like FMN-containing flavoprotein (pyridoxamine 5'-phosphate oxidase superfamily)